MSKGRTQRVSNLINGGYIELWKKGYTPKQIADKFNVSYQTVYRSLQEIADKNGLTREELLVEPNHSGPIATRNYPLVREKIRAENLKNEINSAKKSIEKIIDQINVTLKELEEEKQ